MDSVLADTPRQCENAHEYIIVWMEAGDHAMCVVKPRSVVAMTSVNEGAPVHSVQ